MPIICRLDSLPERFIGWDLIIEKRGADRTDDVLKIFAVLLIRCFTQ
jgi:hypothetical protein